MGKSRVRRLREQAKEYGYLKEDGTSGAITPPPYPEALFPDPVDGRSLKISDPHKLLARHHAWIRECLETGWHLVSVFEELPVNGISRSSFYRYLERHKLTRLGKKDRGVILEIIHQPGEALILDWGSTDSPADVNGDGIVAVADLIAVIVEWGPC